MKAVVMVGSVALWLSAEAAALDLYPHGPTTARGADATAAAQRLYPPDPAPPPASAAGGMPAPQAGIPAAAAPEGDTRAQDGEPGTGMLLLAGLAMLLFMATRRGA